MNKKRILLVALCVVLVAALAIGGTVAWLTASSDAVTNTFTPGDVTVEIKETVKNNIKKSVQIKNTGNVDAYIRVAVIVNCTDASGNVIMGTLPKWTPNSANWQRVGDYYYYKGVLSVDGSTENLLGADFALQDASRYYSMEILVQSIQAEGTITEGGVTKTAVEDAWKMTYSSTTGWSAYTGG